METATGSQDITSETSSSTSRGSVDPTSTGTDCSGGDSGDGVEHTVFAECDLPQVRPSPIEAYAHAGYEANVLVAGEFDDWHTVTLDEPGGLRATLAEPPAGHRMRIRIYDDPAASPLDGDGGSGTGEVFSAEVADLEPGLYYVLVQIADREPEAVTGQNPDPQSWSTPYTVCRTSSDTRTSGFGDAAATGGGVATSTGVEGDLQPRTDNPTAPAQVTRFMRRL